jgi:hypothetical protein
VFRARYGLIPYTDYRLQITFSLLKGYSVLTAGAANGKTIKPLGLSGFKHACEHAGEGQGSRPSAETITETGNAARGTAICLQRGTLKDS